MCKELRVTLATFQRLYTFDSLHYFTKFYILFMQYVIVRSSKMIFTTFPEQNPSYICLNNLRMT
ncbi:hypothetical protein HanXRQr2_Chr14g0645271 [Helianthus annuus]|uniref:Uncharacterized protein n=1 Tax=Helianthus annuus TaxID=4232 RepID=A0A9K3H7R2_HELAN|nr:hypothetical protein HanXRQr2_Chr14g0645271 [Helianthus annuus]